MKNPMIIIMLGPPGSGKGTQAKFITKDYMLPQISTGDLLRNAVKEKSLLGEQAKEFMDAGQLVPDALVLQLLSERIKQEDCLKGFVLDGYPRNTNQAKDLAKITSVDLVINIDVDHDIIVERITGRRTCRQCGAIYHIKYNPPKETAICDQCSGELYQRSDDTEETVKTRLQTYEEQTKPLIKYYSQQGLLRTLKSEGTIEEIRTKISNLLTSLKKP